MDSDFSGYDSRDNIESEMQELFDFDEAYRIRSKMLGVLIRDARLYASRTVEECAQILQVTPELFEQWEHGEAVPDLPQLELLAYYLDIPVNHFWSQQLLGERDREIEEYRSEYLRSRHRTIGVLLRISRERIQYDLREVSQITNISVEKLRDYEAGNQPIPMPELVSLARAVNRTPEYFLESADFVNELLSYSGDQEHLSRSAKELREFAANPHNADYIRIAKKLSELPVNQRRVLMQIIRNFDSQIIEE